WTASANMSAKRKGSAAVSVGDGRLVVAGGWSSDTGWLQSAEVFNNGVWASAGNLQAAVVNVRGAALPSGFGALFVGGTTSSGTYSAYADIFDSHASTLH